MNGQNDRPRYRDAYKHRRVLKVYFYTSNIDKLLQGRLIFGRYGQQLNFFRGQHEPYDEDYSGNTHFLLRRAISQILEEFGLAAIFFIEDTSLRIEALSGLADYPGMRAKEWFSETTFEELDQSLRAKGRDRTVVVKSDIALHIPMLSEPIYFHGETSGYVANDPPSFEPNVQYPWLTPDTFNGWFIPVGATRRLGEMEFEESLQFDFRAKALVQLVERLNEYNAVGNIPAFHFYVRSGEPSESAGAQHNFWQIDPAFFGRNVENIVVIGPKCAGKTTLGEYLQARDGFCHIEASTVMRDVAERGGRVLQAQVDVIDFLEECGVDIVAREIASYNAVGEGGLNVNVITGFRAIEELAFFVSERPNTVIVNVDCDARIRFERDLKRGRGEESKSFADFKRKDEEESTFGLLNVADVVSDISISNEASMAEYHRKIEDFLKQVSKRLGKPNYGASEVVRSLRALNALGRRSTCEAISEMTGKIGRGKIMRYNTNRALKSVPELANRHEPDRRNLLRYSISDKGRVFLELLERLEEARR